MKRKLLNDDVDTCLKSLGLRFGQETADSFQSEWHDTDVDLSAGTPIEQIMSVALLYVLKSKAHFGYCGDYIICGSAKNGIRPPQREGFIVCPQARVGKYRADFFVGYRHFDGTVISAAIECDGHEFHEKTKKQAQRDKERDRFFQSLGLLVLRYSGSEIFHDPVKCASDALRIIYDRAEASREGRDA